MKKRLGYILIMLAMAVSAFAQKGGDDAEEVAVGSDVFTVVLPAKSGYDEQSIDLILVKSGRFLMGATSEQAVSDDDEKPAHIVLITKEFYIGETEVTQDLWEYVMGNNPSTIKGAQLPVESISWEDAKRFCERLSALTGYNFRLPTEAEWEYAARGGHKYVKPQMYAGGYDINSLGWHIENSRANLKEVKSMKPNELGIYDMSGNVYEYCLDTKEKYSGKQQTDPVVDKGPTGNKVRRGGSCKTRPDECRVSYRRRVAFNKETGDHPGSDDTGLRVVMDIPADQ